MDKIKINAKDVTSFIIIVCIAILIISIGLIAVGNKAEIYDDIIIETVASNGMNKTGELKIFWIVLFAGIPVLLAINYFINRKGSEEKSKELKDIFVIELILSVAQIMLFIITGNFNSVLICAMLIAFLDYIIYPGKEKNGLILSIIIYYFLLSLCAIYNNRGGTKIFNSNLLLIITLFINIIVMLIEKKKEIMNKLMLIMQTFIPALLLLYACQRYNIGGGLLYISIPVVAKILIYGTIAFMFFFALYQLIKKWKKAKELPLNEIILVTTCMIIFAVNYGTKTSMIVPEDLHHSAESIISYQQIIGKGQMPYTEYSPVSGLFPFIIGGILEIFGGNITTFNLAHIIYLVIFAMLTMYILSKYINKEDCLIISMLYRFPSYDRATLILPAILILLLPNLIKNRNLWLKVWIWICFICGIYYPAFGGAILLGTLPLGVVQFYKMIKEDGFKEKLKSAKFYLTWIVCLFPIIIAFPMLLNMAKHILIYSSQTALADGISAFGQKVPDNFLSYLSGINYIREIIYYAMRYMIPIACVWLLVLILSKTIHGSQLRKEVTNKKSLILISFIIILIISYTYTIVRLDTSNGIAGRSTYVIIPVVGILLYVFIKRHVQINIPTSIIMGMVLGLAIIMTGASPILSLDKFIYAYTINADYQIISEQMKEKYPRMGNGFVLKEQLATFEKVNNKVNSLRKYDPNLKFYSIGQLGVYYTLDLTTVGQPSIAAIKDYKTHQEVIQAIQEQRPVVGMQMSPTTNYYLYNWLLTTNEYVYDSEYELFMPIELYKNIYGEEKVPTDKREVPLCTSDLGLIANSLGKSINSLKNILDTVDISIFEKDATLTERKTLQYTLDFSKEIYGADADYMYIEFDINGNIYPDNQSKLSRILTKQYYNTGINVIVSWGEGEKDYIKAKLNDGKLLFPLGSNVNWLLNNHDSIKVTIENVDKKIDIKEINFYKLQTNR